MKENTDMNLFSICLVNPTWVVLNQKMVHVVLQTSNIWYIVLIVLLYFQWDDYFKIETNKRLVFWNKVFSGFLLRGDVYFGYHLVMDTHKNDTNPYSRLWSVKRVTKWYHWSYTKRFIQIFLRVTSIRWHFSASHTHALSNSANEDVSVTILISCATAQHLRRQQQPPQYVAKSATDAVTLHLFIRCLPLQFNDCVSSGFLPLQDAILLWYHPIDGGLLG